MNIGLASKRSGIPTKTIRYYEDIKLISPAKRKSNGYRDYSESDVAILHFIQRSRNLGFSISDTENLVLLWRDQHRASSDVKALAQSHITEIEKRIQELQEVRNTLVDLTDKCQGDNRPDCPIINAMADA
jgi:Cu(I)-responsive transcriptional regulator